MTPYVLLPAYLRCRSRAVKLPAYLRRRPLFGLVRHLMILSLRSHSVVLAVIVHQMLFIPAYLRCRSRSVKLPAYLRCRSLFVLLRHLMILSLRSHSVVLAAIVDQMLFISTMLLYSGRAPHLGRIARVRGAPCLLAQISLIFPCQHGSAWMVACPRLPRQVTIRCPTFHLGLWCPLSTIATRCVRHGTCLADPTACQFVDCVVASHAYTVRRRICGSPICRGITGETSNSSFRIADRCSLR